MHVSRDYRAARGEGNKSPPEISVLPVQDDGDEAVVEFDYDVVAIGSSSRVAREGTEC
jgi:hypothetical protein